MSYITEEEIAELQEEVAKLRAENQRLLATLKSDLANIAGLLELAATRIDPHFGHTPEDVNGHPHPNVCATCTERLFNDDGEDQWTDEQVEYWRSDDSTVIKIRETAARMRADAEVPMP